MSGPTTAILTADPLLVLISAAAIRTAEAVAEAHAAAAQLAEQHQQEKADNAQRQQSAAAQGQAGFTARSQAAENRFAQLLSLADQLGQGRTIAALRPVRPAEHDLQAMLGYVGRLEALTEECQQILIAEVAGSGAEMPLEINLPTSVEATSTTSPTLPQDVQRLLARIAHLGEVPEGIAQLARDLTGTAPGQRADLLASELRRRIQLHLADNRDRQLAEAQTLILEQSLKDLGYQVETMTDTLFVEGGMVHFRKPGWQDHMVRMRVDAKNNSANFNVIRAVEGQQNETTVLDHIAEDRWCAEFPALLQALALRGMHLNVTRRLEAGEVPVQLVQKDKLPRFTDDDATRPKAQPLMKHLS